ncbi:serine hydrolase domain-containing protein [Actinacidiphila yeochonensis]|uniref:serine hydrolase domain-containing protein n=1 Tax=Actinacidiphila yeochonensis TaxID=89050 RepID=UPI00055BBB0C|nr:serine hydrolase domain-containing protein [Actinacidiphila yeochonensis]
MAELKVEIDPADAGFDPERLARIGSHFGAYVEDGRLAGWLSLISRDGRIAHLETAGHRDKEAGLPVESDTLFRTWSLTKPITSVAAMILYEEGRLGLHEPVSDYIPSLANVRVYQRGPVAAPVTVPAAEPVRIWHLLTHTAGFTYGFHHAHPVDEIYTAEGFEWSAPPEMDLATAVDTWAGLPLLHHPGERWNYGVSSDILGRVIEIVSGQTLDRFFAERVFEPLGLTDTGFWVPEADAHRLAGLYAANPADGKAVRNEALGGNPTVKPRLLSGSSGLITSAGDYHRFLHLLLNGGELDGVRLLSPRTVRYMTRNQLPGGADLATIGRPVLFGLPSFGGLGFGFGFATVQDAAAAKVISNEGEFSWYTASSMFFWVDPVERLIGLFFAQLVPVRRHPLYSRVRQLAYQALVD